MNQQILSQDEVDALLQGITGESQKLEPEEAPATGVRAYDLAPAIRVHWLADGDHGFKPRKASGRGERQNWDEAIGAIAAFVADLRS